MRKIIGVTVGTPTSPSKMNKELKPVRYTEQSLTEKQQAQARENIGAAPASHVSNKDNPHGVTIAQIGAAPAGFGLGAWATEVTDLDNARLGGWYYGFAGTANSPTPECLVIVEASMFNDDWIVQRAYSLNGGDRSLMRQYVRYRQNKYWSAWVNHSPSAFAPAGYGLGEYVPVITDANKIGKTGWTCGTNVANSPPNIGSCLVYFETIVHTAYWRTQRAHVAGHPGEHSCVAVRDFRAGQWYDWEWENPPMKGGYVYRTTERYLNKPVYCKLVHYGKFPDGGTSWIYHNISGANRILRWEAYNDFTGTNIRHSDQLDWIRVSTTQIYAATFPGVPGSTWNVWFIIWYTKE